MLAVEIPDPLLTALVSISFPLVVGLMAWIVRELTRISQTTTRLEERQRFSEWRHDAHEARLRELEHVAGFAGQHDQRDIP